MTESQAYKDFSKKVATAKGKPPGKRIKILLDATKIYHKGV